MISIFRFPSRRCLFEFVFQFGLINGYISFGALFRRLIRKLLLLQLWPNLLSLSFKPHLILYFVLYLFPEPPHFRILIYHFLHILIQNGLSLKTFGIFFLTLSRWIINFVNRICNSLFLFLNDISLGFLCFLFNDFLFDSLITLRGAGH